MSKPVLKKGSRGESVKELQVALKALGYYQAYAVDAVFGPGTENAVIQFQTDTPRLTIDGIVGPATWGALDGALLVCPEEQTPSPDIPEAIDDLTCDDLTWNRWLDLVNLVTTTPCKYGPGRGAFDNDRWLIRDRAGNYPNGSRIGYHAFVCSTWTNFVCGYLLNYNNDYTPEGGMPSMAMVCESPRDKLVPVPGLPGAKFRGYGDYLTKVSPHVKDVTLSFLYTQRLYLPTFIIANQSSRKRGWWNYHHCAVYVIDRRQQGSPLYRIAADGYKGRNGFSGTPMVYRKVTPDYIDKHDAKHRIRCYAITGLEKAASDFAYPAVLE